MVFFKSIFRVFRTIPIIHFSARSSQDYDLDSESETDRSFARTNLRSLSSLIILMFIAASIAVYRFIVVSNSQSFGWDSAAFMEKAAVFAGFGQYQQGFEPGRPPFLPIVLSFLFRLTGPIAYDAYLLSGVLYFFAILGGYLLAREIMNPFLAIAPAVSFAFAPMVIMWEGIMYSNVEGVAVASIALPILAFSTKPGKNMFYLLAVPLLALAPLTRFTMGIVWIAALVYLVTSGNVRKILSDRYFRLGAALAFAIGLAISLPWIRVTLLLGFPALTIFPSPSELNPFQSSLGKAFFPLNFPNEVGVGVYGYLITALFVFSLIYSIARLVYSAISRRKTTYVDTTRISTLRSYGNSTSGFQSTDPRNRVLVRKNAMISALLTWFMLLFLYYVLLWPYDDLRYSIEFILPALILSYFFLGECVTYLYHYTRRSASKLPISASIAVIAIVLFAIAILATQSAVTVNQNTPVVDTGISSGMRQAASWVSSNLAPGTKIEADWYTFGRWYLPNYNVSVAPSAYQLIGPANYQSWQSTIAATHISYVIYSIPSEINVPSNFHVVFTSSNREIVVYKIES
jgi:4-amino-4-deoxy-L-arabinose transferase-like glycosyltransferase